MLVSAEFRIFSNQREGLLLDVGKILSENGFHIRRQRLTPGGGGAILVIGVKGQSDSLLHVQESLVNHPLVRSFEMEMLDIPEKEAPASPRVRGINSPAAPVPAPVAQEKSVPPAATALSLVRSPPTASSIKARPETVARYDSEAVLARIAQTYPNVFPHLETLEGALAPEQFEPTMIHVGRRVGAWVYKRDFALGGRLELPEALRRIVLPAMRRIVQVGLRNDLLEVHGSPFCHRGHAGECCHFFRGFIDGLLVSEMEGRHLTVSEIACCNTGAASCHFSVV